jgi:hypothetical protein
MHGGLLVILPQLHHQIFILIIKMIVRRSQFQCGLHKQDGVIEPALRHQKAHVTKQHLRTGRAQGISLSEGIVCFKVHASRTIGPIHQSPLIQARDLEKALGAKSFVKNSWSPLKSDKSFSRYTLSANTHTLETDVSGFNQSPSIAPHCFDQNARSASRSADGNAGNG